MVQLPLDGEMTSSTVIRSRTRTWRCERESDDAMNVASTFFSEEDLFSNLLGFWAATQNKSFEQAKQPIRNMCNSFVKYEGDPVGIQASLNVYDNVYGGWIWDVTTGREKKWLQYWRYWKPRLIKLPSDYGSASHVCLSEEQMRIGNCAVSDRHMPVEVQTLLDTEQRRPHFLWPAEVAGLTLVNEEDVVRLYETTW